MVAWATTSSPLIGSNNHQYVPKFSFHKWTPNQCSPVTNLVLTFRARRERTILSSAGTGKICAVRTPAQYWITIVHPWVQNFIQHWRSGMQLFNMNAWQHGLGTTPWRASCWVLAQICDSFPSWVEEWFCKVYCKVLSHSASGLPNPLPRAQESFTPLVLESESRCPSPLFPLAVVVHKILSPTQGDCICLAYALELASPAPAVIKNLLMPLFLMGCFPVDLQEVKRPLRTKSVKRPIKVGKRPINEGKRPIKAKVLVGFSVGSWMGCSRAPPPWRKTAPLKRPIKRSMR